METSRNESIYRFTGTMQGESTGHQWITLIKATNVEILCVFDVNLNS